MKIPRFLAVQRNGPTAESQAWCEVGCGWEAVDGRQGSYRASKAARRHTEQTGHTTTLDRSYTIFFEARPR